MIGWRGKIGLLVPSGNTVIEPEFQAMVPQGVAVYAARMRQTELTKEALISIAEEAKTEIKKLADAGCDLVIYGLTAGTMMFGTDYDKILKKQLFSAGGIDVITVASAVVEELKFLGMEKICMITPYTQEVNEREKKFLKDCGITVTADICMGLNQLKSISNQNPKSLYRLVCEVYKQEVDGIFISCTNLPSLEILDFLTQDFGKPTISSNSATCDVALRRLGISHKS